MPGASAEALRDAVYRMLTENPQSKVSTHVHLCVVRRGSVNIEPSDFLAVDAEGGEWRSSLSRVPGEVTSALGSKGRQIKMPTVAQTPAELDAMCTQEGSTATAAEC